MLIMVTLHIQSILSSVNLAYVIVHACLQISSTEQKTKTCYGQNIPSTRQSWTARASLILQFWSYVLQPFTTDEPRCMQHDGLEESVIRESHNCRHSSSSHCLSMAVSLRAVLSQKLQKSNSFFPIDFDNTWIRK